MSEKQQGKSSNMRRKMLERYGEINHKHDKNHSPYRKHFRSHPHEITEFELEEDRDQQANSWRRELNIRKTRKRISRGEYH